MERIWIPATTARFMNSRPGAEQTDVLVIS